jgi:WD40 repeat protein
MRLFHDTKADRRSLALPLAAGVLFHLLILCAPRQSLASEPSTEPIPRIEAGMHAAPIRRIFPDAAARLALTLGNDKTARLWELASGRLLRILRPPIGVGPEGELDAGAFSADGTLAAVAGYTGVEWDRAVSIYLFDTTTGRMVRRLSGFPQVVVGLAFSPGGRWLAVGLGDKSGLRILDVAEGREVARDEAYTKPCGGLEWRGDNQLLTASLDERLRLYGWNDRPPAVLKPLHSAHPAQAREMASARFSPDGRRIAVGFEDSRTVAVFSGSDLSPLFSADTKGFPSDNLGTVGWNADGTILAAGGMWVHGHGSPIRVWRDSGRGEFRDFPVARNTIMNLQPLPDGRLLYCAADPAWGILDPSTGATQLGAPPIGDFRDNLATFQISDDARKVAFAFQQFGKEPATFDLSQRLLRSGNTGEKAPTGLHAARTEGLRITDWEFTKVPKLGGKPLKLKFQAPWERSICLAIAPDASSFVLGGDLFLRSISARGAPRWETTAPGAIWCVNLSADGRVAVAAFSDGTIRWYRADNGTELLALFPHADRERWVLWTPQGYYDASPKGEDLIGWHVNRGKDSAADFFPASKFRDQFYRPDVIARVIETLDVGEALKEANAAIGRKEQPAARVEDVVARMQPPVVQLMTGGVLGEASVPAGESAFVVHYRVRQGGADPVTRVRILLDGRPVNVQTPVPASDTAEAQASIPLPAKDSILTVLAENRFAVSEPATLRLVHAVAKIAPAPASEPAALKPKLYLFAAGISHYAKNDYLPDLGYAAKDASDFSAAFARQEGGLYQKVESRVLTDAKANAGDILDGLDWIKKSTTSKDVAIVFLSGHGENDEEGRFYFCAHDYDHTRRLRTGVSFEDIQKTLASISGKVLFFIDSCHAGNALGKLYAAKGVETNDLNRVVNELSSAENGAIVFASSTGRQQSVESDEWKNGAFTKAIVEGLDGKADFFHNGKITVSGLETYLAERVKELTDGQQSPTVAKPQTVPDFPIAIVK